MLLVRAGLFAQTLANLKNTDTGFEGIENVVTFQLDPATSGYPAPRIRRDGPQKLDTKKAFA